MYQCFDCKKLFTKNDDLKRHIHGRNCYGDSTTALNPPIQAQVLYQLWGDEPDCGVLAAGALVHANYSAPVIDNCNSSQSYDITPSCDTSSYDSSSSCDTGSSYD